MLNERVGPVLGWTLLAVLAYACLLTIRPFFVPLAWAAVLATVFYPRFGRLEPNWGAARSAAGVTVVATILVAGPLFIISTLFVREAVQAAAALDDGRYAWAQQAIDAIQQRIRLVERVDIAAVTAEGVKRGAMLVASQSVAVVIGPIVLATAIGLLDACSAAETT